MPSSLKRYQECGDLHFITFSCHERRSYLAEAEARDQFLISLEMSRQKYDFTLHGFVVMPEHIHLLITEPKLGQLPAVIQAVKQSVARRRTQRPFWYPRSYDFNVYTEAKRIEKLTYMHWNPVKRSLCTTPESWPWSSATSSPARIPTSSPAAPEIRHPHQT